MELLIAVGHLVPLEPRLKVVFNTGMTGYQEVTDPSYCGQIVVLSELVAGVNQEDEESDRPQVQGAIARNIPPSLATGDQLLAPDYLKQHLSQASIPAPSAKSALLELSTVAFPRKSSTKLELLEQVLAAPSMTG